MNQNLFSKLARAILVALLCLQGASAAVNELVPTGSYTQDPYKWTGMIIANGDAGAWRGSGSVIWHPKMAVSCAHTVFKDNKWIAASNTTWSRAYSGNALPSSAQRMPFAGRYDFQGYQSSAINLGVTAPATFSLDLVSFWSYENTADGGHGGSVENGIDALVRIIPKMFSGYPAQPNGISTASYSMWRTSEFSERYVHATGRYYISGAVGSHGGVSGGPLWVYTNANWYQAGVVVSGSSTSNGVVGFDISTKLLFEAAAAAATPPPPATPSIKITSPIGAQIHSWGSAYHIGTLPVGSSRTENFTIRNTGSATLTLSNLVAAPPFSASFTTGTSIPAGGSGTLRITFSPTAAGAAGGAGAVRFATNDPTHNKQNLGGGIYNEFSMNISGSGSVEGALLPELTLGTSRLGSLSSTVRSTTYSFATTTAGNYRFYTTGNPDTVGELFDSDNQRITYNDENARYIAGKPGPVAGANFMINIQLQPGIYYLKVSGYDSTVTGSYLLFAEQRAPRIEVSMLGFEIDPAEIFFYGFYKLGLGKSASLDITVKNTGTAQLFLDSVALGGENASEFSISGPAQTTLAVGTQTTIKVTITPASLGHKEAILWINSTDPVNSPVGIMLYGNGILEPGLAIEYPAGTQLTSGATLAFGNVNRGTFLDRTVTIRNPGEAILEIPSTIIRETNLGDFTFVTAPPSTLAPGATATFTIRFTPSGSGSRTAIVDIANNVNIGVDFFLNLSATGVATPEIAIESPSGSDLVAGSAMVLFGSTDLGSNSVRSFTIRNLGTDTLSGIAATFSGGNSSDFSLITTPPTNIQAGGSSTFSVRFNPGAAGVRSTTLKITSNDADENPFNTSLSGTGVSTPKLVFGYTAGIDLPSGTTQELLLNNFKVGSTMTRSYIIKNQGTAPLSNIAVSLSGENSDEFSIAAHPAATIAPGASSFFTFRFTPIVPGVRTATINIASNDPDNPFTITHFSNVAGAPKIAVSEIDRNFVSGSDLVDFGEVFTGKQSSRTFIIRNEGSADLTGLSVAFHGGFSTGFSLTQPAPSIPLGGISTFTITFAPNAGGLRTTVLRIASNDSDHNPFQIQISGSGIIVPDIEIYGPDGDSFISGENPLAFETTPVNSMKSIRLKIKNGGIGTLNGIHAQIEGADAEDFSFQYLPPESPYPTNLSPGLEHEFFVQFLPKAAGSRNANFKITSHSRPTGRIGLRQKWAGVEFEFLPLGRVLCQTKHQPVAT